MFSIRIVTTSHYQATPLPGFDVTHSEFRDSQVKRVPVLRIFGSTPSGQKTCMHVHGVFPYLYVPYDGTQPTDRYLKQFAASLDKAINIASRSVKSDLQHVFKISLVSGIPMYGYHGQEQPFLKIYLYSPNNVRKAADLLLGGAVMNKPFQPHEAHLPYYLQLFMDYNLYGMNLINVGALKFRYRNSDAKKAEANSKSGKSSGDSAPDVQSSNESFSAPTPLSSCLPASDPLSSSHIWNEENIPSELWHPADIERQSTCELEVDVVAADIVNRQEVAGNIGTNPGLAALWEDEKQRRREAGESSQITSDASQERPEVKASESEKELLARLYEMVQEQNALIDSQSNDSESTTNSQTSLLASQLERHTSREDSPGSSPSTVILASDEEDEGTTGNKVDKELAIVNVDSIHKVVASSQSFSTKSSQGSESQDRTVAEILASLLEENANPPPSSQVTALEEKDSILSTSVMLNEEDEDEERRETLAMSQAVVEGDNEDDFGFGASRLDETWCAEASDKDPNVDVVMETDIDESDDEDDIDLLPQFDGASDKLTNSHLNQSHQAMSENRVAGHSSMASHGPMSPYSSSTGEPSWAGRGSQQYSGSSSWVQQQQQQAAWGQQQQVPEVAWPSRSPSWGSQQQSYSHWQPQAQQLPLSGSQYSPSQHARSPSVASPASSHSFHSPSHHPYTSPTHSMHLHQGYSSPGSSSSQQSYAHSPTQYQSPTQEMYLPPSYQRHGYHQYPPGHSYQTSYSGQQYPQQSTGQSYKSPPVTQAYMSPSTTNPNPPYQPPTGNVVLPSSNSSQVYRSPSNNPSTSPSQTFGTNSGQPNKACQNSPSSSYQSHYQSPPYNHPYYSPSHSARHSSASASSGLGHFQKGVSHMKTPEQTGQMPSKCPTASSLLKPLGDKQNMAIVEEKLPASQAKNMMSDAIPGKQSTKSNSVDFLSDLHITNVGNKPPNVEHSSVSAASQTKLSPMKNNHGTHRSTLGGSGSLKSQNPFLSDTNAKPEKWNSLCSHDQRDISVSSKFSDDIPSLVDQCQTSKSISRLDFIPTETTAESRIKSEDHKTSVTTAGEAKSSTQSVKPSVVCNTPMIQQLLMEESPAKINIKPEDREAVMKKPMLSPTRPQKKTKSGRGKAKSITRPRSASLSVGHFPGSEGYGNHLPMLSSTPNPMLNRAGRSHSITLPFGKHPGMIEPMHDWHQQPLCHPAQQHQQQNYSPIPQWQQQQHQWGGNQWQDSASVDGVVGAGARPDKEPLVNRTQQRSYSADCASVLHAQPISNFRQGFGGQQEPLCSSSGNSDVIVSSEAGSRGESIEENGNENDPSSLSNLYQLVSDVSFDGEDNVWENSPTTIVPGFLQDPMENATPKSSSPSADGQDSPDKKDFITLEPPSKASSDRAGSDTTGMTSSEESDRMDYEIAADLIPTQLKGTDFASGWIHPRLGKQNRMKRMGLVGGKGSITGSSNCNPSYTYTFHVPTPVFKKLKFFRSAQARKQDLKVIRMHPMDARRYSLLKIGKELVQVNRLSESDLAKYNCTLPTLAELNQMNSDGSFSRVNLDIPSASSSRSSFNSFGEEGSSFSNYDSDFPPNKVAPPSSFSVTQVATSPSRSSHSLTPPVLSQSASRTTQYPAMAPVSQFGMPGTSGQAVGSQLSDGTSPHHQGQQPVHQEGMYDSFRAGQSYMPRYNHVGGDQGNGNTLPQMNGQMGDQNFHHPANPHACRYSPSHQSVGNTSGPVISSYVQPLQYQQQSRGRNEAQSYWDPKNGSRSPGQHGPIGTIDKGSCSGHSGKDEENNTLQTTTGTFPVNTRVNAQTFNSHAKFMATHIDSDIIDVESCSRKSSLRDAYDGDRDEELHTGNCAFAGMSCTNDCLDSETSPGHVKRRKTRRKRSKRRMSLKRSQVKANYTFSECDAREDIESCYKGHTFIHEKGDFNSEMNASSNNLSLRKNSNDLNLSNDVIDDKNTDSVKEGQSKTSSTLMRKGVVNCKDKNWKSLKLQIPKQTLFQDAPSPIDFPMSIVQPSGTLDTAGSSAEASHHSYTVPDSHQYESLKSPKEPQLGIRQSMRQAKLRSINSNSLQESPARERKKKASFIEGVHYIVIGKFKGHQSMLVKIPRVNVTEDETVSAARYEMLSFKDIVRSVEVPTSGDAASLTTSCPVETPECNPKGSAVSTESFLSQSDFETKIQGKSEASMSEVTNVSSDIVFSGSPCTSPETLFFTQLRKSFDQKSKGRRGKSLRKRGDKGNVFFPGVINSTFLNFQTLFQQNVAKLEVNAYSSSSDEEDDHLDSIILKGKIKLAKDRRSYTRPPVTKILQQNAIQPQIENNSELTKVETETINSNATEIENSFTTLKDSPPAPTSIVTGCFPSKKERVLFQTQNEEVERESGPGNVMISQTSKAEEQDNSGISGFKTGVTCRLKLFFGKGAEREAKEVGMISLNEFPESTEEPKETPCTRGSHKNKKRRKTFKKLKLLRSSSKLDAEAIEPTEEASAKIESSTNQKGINDKEAVSSCDRMKGTVDPLNRTDFIEMSPRKETLESDKKNAPRGEAEAKMKEDSSEETRAPENKFDEIENVEAISVERENKSVPFEGSGETCPHSVASVKELRVDAEVEKGTKYAQHVNFRNESEQVTHTEKLQDLSPHQEDKDERKQVISQGSDLNTKSSFCDKHESRSPFNKSMETEEERKEFIRRQMAFYEDISSDPDTDDTIINEQVPTCSVSGCQSLSSMDTTVTNNLPKTESLDTMRKTESPDVKPKVTGSPSSLDNVEADPDVDPDGTNKLKPPIKTLSDTLHQSSENSHHPLNDDEISQNSCVVHEGESDHNSSSPSKRTVKGEDEKVIKGRQLSQSRTSKKIGARIESASGTERESKSKTASTSSKTSAHSKPKRKSNIKYLENTGSSSSDEKGRTEVSGKRLRQRKQAQYTYYLDGVDSSDYMSSSEDNLSDPSPAHIASRTTGGKNVKVQKRNPGNSGKSSTRGRKSTQLQSTSMRGRKKKVKGGSKLFNSLSLLHMATLANLTESQDSPSSPQGPESGAQYSDRAGNDFTNEYSPSLEVMSFTSPQNSEELDSSPLPFSPTDKKLKKQCQEARNISPSVRRRLLPLPARHRNIKPGCNGASNVGTRPFSLNRLMNPIAGSSVPSNLIFSHNSADSSDQVTEAPEEDQSLVAKVKTTPFSMKHILRLATTDDSMDSDSKDSLAVLKAPETKRAQVKSTALSMSDILKMTSVNSADESENTEASNSLLSQIASFDDKNIVPASCNDDESENAEASSSLLSQIANFDDKNIIPTARIADESENTEASNSVLSHIASFDDKNIVRASLNTDESENTEASSSLLSQIANFDGKNIVRDSRSADESENTEASSSLLSQISKFEAENIPAFKNVENVSLGYRPLHSEVDVKETSKSAANEEVEESVCKTQTTMSPQNNDKNVNKTDPMGDQDDSITRPPLLKQSPASVGKPKSEHHHSDSEVQSQTCLSTQQSLEDLDENCGQAALTPVTRLKPTTHLSYTDACQGEEEADQAQDKGLAHTPGDAVKSPPVRCLSPLNCIIEETQLSRSSHDNVSSGEPDHPVREDTFRQNSVSSLTVSPSVTGSRENKQDETSDNCKDVLPKMGNHKQKCDDKTKEKLPVITETLVESDTRDLSPYRSEKSDNGNMLKPVSISAHYHQPLSSHSSPQKSASSSSLHTSYPWCWQWPVPPFSEESIGPLNLCTSKPQTVYSPITPPSPISPYMPLSLKASNLSVSKMSPPVKKAKPLWYPWLSAEEARQKHSDLQKSLLPTHSEERKNNTDNSGPSKTPEVNHMLSPNQSAVTTMNTLSSPPIHSSHTNDSISPGDKDQRHSSKSRESEAHVKHVEKSSTNHLKVQKEPLSYCKTVSQFLGTVIDSAYEQANSLKKHSTRSERDNSSKKMEWEPHQTSGGYQRELMDRKHKSEPFTLKDVGYSVRPDSHRISSSYSCQEWDPHYPIRKGHSPLVKTCVENTFPASARKSENERVQSMLENERIIRDKFALSSPHSSHPSSKILPQQEPMSRTDRLVTQLIKGKEPLPFGNEPHDASRRRHKGGKSAKDDASAKNSQTVAPLQGSSVQTGSGKPGGKAEGKEARLDRKCVSALKGDKEVVIQPVKTAPSKSRIEESLSELGLNAVQVPVAFCSSMEDLPDKPVEQGGRVLRVASRRVCELKPFTNSHFIDGIQNYRSNSLASSNLLSSQAESKPFVDQLHDNPQLRFLLTPDRPVVIAPCRMPIKRNAVAKWLQPRMRQIAEMKENIRLPAEMQPHKENQARAKRKNSSDSEVQDRTEAEMIASTPMFCHSQTLDSSPEPCDSTFFDTDLDLSVSPTQSFVTHKKAKLDASDRSLLSSSAPRSGRKRQRRQDQSTNEETVVSDSISNSKTTKQSLNKRFDIASHPYLLDKPKISNVHEEQVSSAQEKKNSETSSNSLKDNSPTLLLKHVSTGSENTLRRHILLSQTQRQFSELGFTAAERSQIEGPTPQNTHNFKVPKSNIHDAKTVHKHQCVTALSLELQIQTRGDMRPDPEFDAIQAVFYAVFDDVPVEKGPRSVTGMIVVDRESWEIVTGRLRTVDSYPSTPSKSQHKQGLTQTAYSPQPSTSNKGGASPSPSKGKGKGKGKGKRSATPTPKPKTPPRQKKSSKTLLEKCGLDDVEVTYVQDEMDLLHMLMETIARFDPDILVGFEIQTLSWGYLLNRAAQLGIELCSKIARVPDAKAENRFTAADDEWGADRMSEIHIAGRIVLNLWRVLRHEVSLNTYTFENAAYHILHERIPVFSFRTLSKWFSCNEYHERWRVIEHYVRRVQGQLKMMDQLDLIGKTSEFARVFGIEFFDVLSRGSQIRVESMMLRLAKPMNYVAVSPNVNQRARQRAPEVIALTLEPESKYYTSPVVVLDFQSLYPSIMIAYNYCFSTCLGRLHFLEKAQEGPIEFGCTSLRVDPGLLKKLKNKVTVSPNGVVFVKPSVRKGIISAMVEEILDTRIMVKKSMKTCKDDKTLARMLDARQLGLKLIANVTYGYTGASFSGRMPCVEVADSIVRKARESLERAIKLVEDTPRWGARVVYGDTDSMFIHFPGRSKDEAFVLGHEIADAVTAMFPKPMKLKFEKVYLPCVLQTKKRYVGFMYETPDQKDPVFDAKGIETVRRDSCSAVSKILERSIKVLFSTHDLSRVRAYVTRQLHKLLEGKVSILDLIFAKEFRGMSGYKPGACVPALEIARKRAHKDRCAEPRVGERVPYVIVHGSPGLPLIQLVREPEELIKDSTLRLNATYYITKQILPPLDRLFSLIGVNVFKWYQDMPKVVRLGPMMSNVSTVKQGTISQFFASSNCVVCDTQCKNQICNECRKDPQLVIFTINNQMREWEKTYNRLSQVCNTCQGVQDTSQPCLSMDCPIVFRRHIAKQDLLRADTLKSTLQKFLQI